ncbi:MULTISPECIES: hypothetical protein [unclassified Pseudoclavibacter]|uniref:hypothetical protein n=1 Tax=unclassified Pseudoclavibacter TaxID=2615177 RepID=UPI0012F089E9|nr:MULTISPECIES: hypothetical protein [unclassified Pseudoclavibacter]MBF4457380.1 hypothetical protein [Pseudoclavibacter sp. VKM Ac-2867]VXC43490.1 conserved exported hypothetical protein [Pseudoclavibacter sp. 8L]
MTKNPDANPSELNRRKLLGAAAWSAPIIALAAATPLAVASSSGGTRTLSTPGSTSIRITPQVRTVEFTVIGGGGGATATSASPAHQGGRLVGTITLPASTTSRNLNIIVGGGATAAGVGGTGYGSGGSGPVYGGGGGSSIALEGTVLVVAGGGGGRSVVSGTQNTYTVIDRYATNTQVPSTGSSAAGSNGMTRQVTQTSTSQVFVGAPGSAASGATGGAGGVSTANFPATNPSGATIVRSAGAAGQNHGAGANGGGNGAAGATVGGGSTGAGGGGYAGGGSGGAIQKSNANLVVEAAGGGGGGSNFTAASGVVVTTTGTSNVLPIGPGGHNGTVIVTWRA